MRRLFWFALGAAAGVVVARQVRKKAEAFTSNGVGRSVARLTDSMKAFAEDVRAGMAEREYELSAVLHADGPPDREAFGQLVGNVDRRYGDDGHREWGSTDGER
jgi:hypothetical protein